MLPGSASAPGWQRRRGDHVRDPLVVLGREADVEVGAERPRDLLGEEAAERPAGDPPDDLTDAGSPG